MVFAKTKSLKTFHTYFIITAEPAELFLALTHPLTIQLWTGEPAEMDTTPGSRFSLWDGAITGTNIRFEADRLLVQHWDFGDQPDISEVSIKLHVHPKGTSAELTHTNIPDEAWDDITSGWKESYFGALQEFYS